MFGVKGDGQEAIGYGALSRLGIGVAMASVWKWLRRILGAALALVLLAFAGLVINGRMTDAFEVSPLNLEGDTQVVVLLFHGSLGADMPIWDTMTDRISDLMGDEPGLAVVNYNWSAGADNMQRAGANAEIFARSLGQELSTLEDLTHVHMVAHSAGAYVLDTLCESYRESAQEEAHIEMTFLDPFGNRDIVDINRGNRNYGSCADYASAYINTDDPVPSTNSPLQNAYNFDVTNSSDRGDFAEMGHVWPLPYFLQVLDESLLRPGARSHSDFPRGAVIMVD